MVLCGQQGALDPDKSSYPLYSMGLPRPGRPFRDGVILAKRRDRQIIAAPRKTVYI